MVLGTFAAIGFLSMHGICVSVIMQCGIAYNDIMLTDGCLMK